MMRGHHTDLQVVLVDLKKERLGIACPWDIATEGLEMGSVVYSFGVGEDASFEVDLIKKFNLTVHAFDPTPKSVAWVKRQDFPAKFVLHEYGVAEVDGSVRFNPPDNPDHVSYTILEKASAGGTPIFAPMKRLKTIMMELDHPRVDVLKMNIEGAEYGVIKDLDGLTVLPRQILVEFHHRFLGVDMKKTKEAFDRLIHLGYQPFSVYGMDEQFSFVLGR